MEGRSVRLIGHEFHLSRTDEDTVRLMKGGSILRLAAIACTCTIGSAGDVFAIMFRRTAFGNVGMLLKRWKQGQLETPSQTESMVRGQPVS